MVYGRCVSNPFRTGRYCAVECLSGIRPVHSVVSNPFRTGRYCAVCTRPRTGLGEVVFQTPSERGGIVLTTRGFRLWPGGCGFKPLQNGAVLCWLSPRPARARARAVSNPFRTGRYCAVNEPWVQYLHPLSRFKPLQNGAVLCWPERTSRSICFRLFQTPSERGGIVLRPRPARRPRARPVSNPFRTGRYCAGMTCTLDRCICRRVSNPFRTGRYCAGWEIVKDGQVINSFQTPSERGGIVLHPACALPARDSRRFKPLQNGAVLCCFLDQIWSGSNSPFQTPSERGGIVLSLLADSER